ncbi:MAG TPA: LapA family protein [Mariprofundaceae bacterium]|nr:LapA family protein [Mariprofundaceae bacterium]
MNWINVLVVLVLTTLATVFAVSNTIEVHLHFAGLMSGGMPLYVPVFVAFLIGFAGGMVSLSFSRRKHKAEIGQLRQENEVLKEELNNLRNLPLQDEV